MDKENELHLKLAEKRDLTIRNRQRDTYLPMILFLSAFDEHLYPNALKMAYANCIEVGV